MSERHCSLAKPWQTLSKTINDYGWPDIADIEMAIVGYYFGGRCTTYTRKKLVRTKLKKTYEEHWLNKIRREPKMRSHVKFKTSFIKEDYLHIKDLNLDTLLQDCALAHITF